MLASEAPDATYAQWLEPCWDDVPVALRIVNGIDLQDDQLLRTKLLPLLQHNKLAIDFYLNAFIFPIFAREFPLKISASGWDIAIKKPHPNAGFSGTNDGRFLLPVTISQIDRDAQLHTNAKVLAHILREENSTVLRYPNFIGSLGLLNRIQKIPSQPTVILDVGAQVLDMSNLEFSRSWLAMYQDHPLIKAAIFFDDSNNLLVLTPDGATQLLIDSPYADRLDQCLVYLDEAHTRGTDLRIPDAQAVVTLGPKLNKDKLVQGCMRMRRLGDGHTLIFMASDEVVNLVYKASNSESEEISTKDVLVWSMRETWQQMHTNLSIWTTQGRSFARCEAAWSDISGIRMLPREEISRIFCEPEARTLEQLYGVESAEILHLQAGDDSLESETLQQIAQRRLDFGSLPIRGSGIHEEIELEFEFEFSHEKEVERVVEKGRDPDPASHVLHPMVERFVITGDASLCQGAGFQPAAVAFKNTSLTVPAGFDKVVSNIVVTEDFIHTIQVPYNHSVGIMDRFIRLVD